MKDIFIFKLIKNKLISKVTNQRIFITIDKIINILKKIYLIYYLVIIIKLN